MTDQELKDLVASLAEDNQKLHKELEELGQKVKKIDRWMTAEIDRKRERNDRWLEEFYYEEDITAYPREFFRKAFGEKIELGGVIYNGLKYNGMETFDRCSNRRGETFEVGLVLTNNDSVVLIDTANKMTADFVDKFAKERVGMYRKFFREIRDQRAYLGIACYSFDDAVLAEAKKNGIGIVRKTADGIEIDAENLKAY